MSDPVNVNNDNPNPTYVPPDINMATALPPEFRDKEFFKDKSFVDVVKEHVNLQELLGKRPAGIPKEDASDEEWGNFIGSIKPKAGSEYVFPETEFSKSGKRNEGYEKAIRDMALEVGIPKRQFSKFVEKIEGYLAQAMQTESSQASEQATIREKEFETLLDNTYGKDKAVVLERTKKLMSEMIDPSLKAKVVESLKDISNEHLFALTSILDGVYKKYLAEDNTPGGADNISGDVDSLRTEAETIMRSKAYSDFREPGHEAAKSRVQEIFKQIALMGTKK